MADDVRAGNGAVRVDLGHGLYKTAVSVIGEGGEAAGRGSTLSGFCNIERKGLAQLTEDVLCDFGVVVKVRSLFCLLDEIAIHIIQGVQGEIAGFAFFIGEAGGDAHQHTHTVEGIGCLAEAQTIGVLYDLGELAAGLRIIFRGDHGGQHGHQRINSGFTLAGKFICEHNAAHGGRRGVRQSRLGTLDGNRRCGGFACRLDKNTGGVEGVDSDLIPVFVFHNPLGYNTIAVIRIFVCVLECSVLSDFFFFDSVIERIERSDAGGTLALYLGFHSPVVMVGVLDGIPVVRRDRLQRGAVVIVGIFGCPGIIGHGSCFQKTIGLIGVLENGYIIHGDLGKSAELVQNLDHLLETAAVGENIFPLSLGILAVLGDGLYGSGFNQAVFVVKLLTAAGNGAVVKMESGEIGRLAEVVLLKLVEMLDTLRCDAVSLALLDHVTGKVFPGFLRIGAGRLGITPDIGVGQSVVPGDRSLEIIAVLVDTLNEDGASGLVVFDTDGPPDPVPGELPDLILNCFLGDLHDSGVQKVLDIGSFEDLVEGIEIAGELQALQRAEGLQGSRLIAPNEGVRIDGLQRRGENHTSQSGKIHKGVGGNPRDIALQNHAGSLVLQVGPGRRVLLAEGGHLAGTADDQGAGPLIVKIREAGTDQLRGAAGGRRGSVRSRPGDVDFHGDHDRSEIDLVPLVRELVPAVTVAPAVPVTPVAVLFTPVPLPVFLRGAGRGVQGSKADHHADDQKNRQKDFEFFHLSQPLY